MKKWNDIKLCFNSKTIFETLIFLLTIVLIYFIGSIMVNL